MDQKLYARIHPEARNGSVPVRLYDVAGIQFSRGGGSYKGWYPVTDDQADRLRRCHVSNGNPNSMRVFQIEEKKTVDELSASEARSRMAPEQQRIDVARDREIAGLKQKLDNVQPLLDLLGGAEGVQRLARLVALDKAASGQNLSPAEAELVAAVAVAPPRRPPMTELSIDDDAQRRATAVQTHAQSTNTSTQQAGDKKAPQAPPARPGTRPGSQAKEEKKEDKKGDKKGRPEADDKPVASAAHVPLPEPLPDQNAIDMAALADDDDDGI